ncbi:MAG: phage tail protein I [Desulfosudaceae bacterium]
MPKYLDDINFRDLLPDSIRDDKTISAAADALDDELRKVNSLLDTPALYERLDDLPEEAVDALAWQYHVDFWEPDLSIERKRDLVRGSIGWHKYKGTVQSVRQIMIRAGFGDAELLEHRYLEQDWIDAGGRFIDGDLDIDGDKTLSSDAGEFKFMTKHWAEFGVRADAAEIALTPEMQQRIIRMIEAAKPVRSHLVGLAFYGMYVFWSRIELIDWTFRIISTFTRCNSVQVPHFDIIGWGCSDIGGHYVTDDIDGTLSIDGRADLDGQRPEGELLDKGSFGTWQAKIRSEYESALGMNRFSHDTLDPDYREKLEMLDGNRDLSVLALDGNHLIDGRLRISVRPITRVTWDAIDGTRTLGEISGPQGLWHDAYIEYWQGNYHYREAI